MPKPPPAAAVSRASTVSGGVSKSLRLITAKSSPRGEPSRAAPDRAAVMPGITPISTGGYSGASSYTREAMPYTPLSPPHTRATLRPSAALLKAIRQRSGSFRMGVECGSFPAMSGRINSRYRGYPTITSQESRASRASPVKYFSFPGPMPITKSAMPYRYNTSCIDCQHSKKRRVIDIFSVFATIFSCF